MDQPLCESERMVQVHWQEFVGLGFSTKLRDKMRRFGHVRQVEVIEALEDGEEVQLKARVSVSQGMVVSLPEFLDSIFGGPFW